MGLASFLGRFRGNPQDITDIPQTNLKYVYGVFRVVNKYRGPLGVIKAVAQAGNPPGNNSTTYIYADNITGAIKTADVVHLLIKLL